MGLSIDEKRIMIDGGLVKIIHTSTTPISGTILFYDTTSTLPIVNRYRDEARYATKINATEQNPNFEVSVSR